MADDAPLSTSSQSITTPDPTEVKPAWYLIKDARGMGSVTVTMVLVSFLCTTIAYVLSIFSKIGPIDIRPFDVAACAAYGTPILTLCFSRKWTDAKYNKDSSQ